MVCFTCRAFHRTPSRRTSKSNPPFYIYFSDAANGRFAKLQDSRQPQKPKNKMDAAWPATDGRRKTSDWKNNETMKCSCARSIVFTCDHLWKDAGKSVTEITRRRRRRRKAALPFFPRSVLLTDTRTNRHKKENAPTNNDDDNNNNGNNDRKKKNNGEKKSDERFRCGLS